MQNVMHIARNAGHTSQNDGRTRVMLAATYLMFAKDQRGGLRSPPGDPPTPILEKLYCLKNDF